MVGFDGTQARNRQRVVRKIDVGDIHDLAVDLDDGLKLR